MRKFLALAVCSLLGVVVVTKVSAQSKNPVRMGVGLNAGATVKDPSRAMLGIDARLQQSLGNGVSGILTTGYYHFLKNSQAGDGFGIVPLKAGLKYFPAKNVYVAGEAGVGFGTQNDAGASFVYSPSVGVAFAGGLDVSLKFEDYTRYNGYASLFALRVAYGFKL